MVVCDSGPLIYLSRISRLSLLKELFDSIEIPASIYREVVEEAKALHKFGVTPIEEAIREGWIKIITIDELEVVNKLATNESIQEEDAEILYLARKLSTKLISNDKWLIELARSFGLVSIWTTTLILLAVRKGKLSKDEGKDLLRKLVLSGLHLKSNVYGELLSTLEEM
ncbi:MAG: hypothetical protein HY929_08735 [Euryarchaeota archaeon]|nr:hypothetical protein [Euryarchaeota archaeon]